MLIIFIYDALTDVLGSIVEWVSVLRINLGLYKKFILELRQSLLVEKVCNLFLIVPEAGTFLYEISP